MYTRPKQIWLTRKETEEEGGIQAWTFYTKVRINNSNNYGGGNRQSEHYFCLLEL